MPQAEKRKAVPLHLKLDIIGSVASGKTTLARKISERYDVPYYEKDNIVWERTPDGDKKRTTEKRDCYFARIISGCDWIVEGSPRKCLKESFYYCDYIIVLDEGMVVRLTRVFRRWIRQRMGKERYNTKPTLTFLRYNVKWVLEFNKIKKSLLDELSLYKEKVKIFRHSDEAWEYILHTYPDDKY